MERRPSRRVDVRTGRPGRAPRITLSSIRHPRPSTTSGGTSRTAGADLANARIPLRTATTPPVPRPYEAALRLERGSTAVLRGGRAVCEFWPQCHALCAETEMELNPGLTATQGGAPNFSRGSSEQKEGVGWRGALSLHGQTLSL